jgi:hemoglobin-like flavoprotein
VWHALCHNKSRIHGTIRSLETIMDIQQSLQRILEQKDVFADLFYLIFLDRYPDVREHFAGVNLKRQGVLLTMALLVIERNHAGAFPSTQQYLRYLGSKHNDRGIPPEAYPKFKKAFLAALERFHSKDWNAALAAEWSDAIDEAAKLMLDGYLAHLSV